MDVVIQRQSLNEVGALRKSAKHEPCPNITGNGKANMKEHLIIFDPQDIRGVRITCEKCKNQIVYTVEARVPVSQTCLQCRQSLSGPDSHDYQEDIRHINNFITAMSHFLSDERKLTIRLEMDADLGVTTSRSIQLPTDETSE